MSVENTLVGVVAPTNWCTFEANRGSNRPADANVFDHSVSPPEAPDAGATFCRMLASAGISPSPEKTTFVVLGGDDEDIELDGKRLKAMMESVTGADVETFETGPYLNSKDAGEEWREVFERRDREFGEFVDELLVLHDGEEMVFDDVTFFDGNRNSDGKTNSNGYDNLTIERITRAVDADHRHGMAPDVGLPASDETRVVHVQDVNRGDSVYCGRADGGNSHILNTVPDEEGWLGNPFSVDEYGRDGAIARFAMAFKKCLENPEFASAVRCLEGEDLACHCHDEPVTEVTEAPQCHAEVILQEVEG
jgi:hypothetical protein